MFHTEFEPRLPDQLVWDIEPDALGSDGESLLQLAIESSPSGVLLVGPAGIIALVNHAAERQFGYSREELVGQPVDMLLPDVRGLQHAPESEHFSTRLPAPPIGFMREVFGRRKDGSETAVHVGVHSVRTDRGPFVVASIVDLTERRRLDRALSASDSKWVPFEELVGELSVGFIDLPPTDVSAGIKEAQRRIVEALELDGSSMFQLGEDGDLLSTHGWWRPGVPAPPARVSARESFPWMLERATAGELVCVSRLDDVPSEVDRGNLLRAGTKSTVAVPLSVAQRIVGVVTFAVTRAERHWTPEILQRLRLVASMFASVLARQHSDEALGRALAEVKRLSDQLRVENVHLRREVEDTLGTAGVVGRSAAIRRVQEQVRQVAETDSTVLLLGETGSGKELFASQIHDLSRRRGRAMVRVNCAAIPATLIESELFGREKGAYTGALSRQIGRFELANGSTIFLDEIGDLPTDVQVKLLRVLEDRQFERLGSSKATKVDTRIIAATHRDLEKRIEADTFREDLYYRLNVFPIRVPPLRERTEDIPMLVCHFVESFSKAFGKCVESIAKDSMEMLQRYAWPGNVRELRNVVERAVIVASGPRLTIAIPHGSAAARRSVRLADVEKEHIKLVLDSTRWRIRGVGGAADQLGLKATTLETRMAKLGLQRPRL